MVDEGGGQREQVRSEIDVTAPSYVVITPAYNEAGFLDKTIASVLRQTVLPLTWIIVDDGSTDGTADVIRRYAASSALLECRQRVRRDGDTYYSSNVYAILQGYEELRHLPFEYLAVLDADIILCPNYYEEIFRRFERNPELGIATGTYVEEIAGRWSEAVIDRRSTPKALQVFRRQCYEQIGGYIACRNGGEDTCTEILARMHGWQTWSFPEIKVVHQRPVGTKGSKAVLQARFRQGLADYGVATHPLFMLAKCLRRCWKERPYVASGLARLAGFAYGYLRREPRELPGAARGYVRREQKQRLWACAGIGPQPWQPAPSDS
jgi:biofilm PGA synthesis N-glycosyltransferase PgaC